MTTEKIFEEFTNLEKNSNLSEINDMWDLIYFFILCEESFDVQIFDVEAEILEKENVKVFQIFEYCEFIKIGKLSDFVNKFITNNSKEISEVRPEAISIIRNNKLKDLFK